MGASKACKIGILVVVGLLLLAANALAQDQVSDPILPEGLAIEPAYSPGFGSPVGMVQHLEDRGVVVHAQMPNGYFLEQNSPLFQKDAVYTLAQTRLQLGFVDQSVIVLGPSTELVIDDSVYTADPPSRSTFLDMALGEGRFVVEKLANARRSDFVVKTQTAVVGVRGSDFVLRSGADATQVTAFEDTLLAVFSLAAPGAEPVLVRALERVYVRKGELPSAVEKVSPGEIEQMKHEFPIYVPSKLIKPLHINQFLIPEGELALPERPELPAGLAGMNIFDQNALSSLLDSLEDDRTSIAETRFEDERLWEQASQTPEETITPDLAIPGPQPIIPGDGPGPGGSGTTP